MMTCMTPITSVTRCMDPRQTGAVVDVVIRCMTQRRVSSVMDPAGPGSTPTVVTSHLVTTAAWSERRLRADIVSGCVQVMS